MCRKQVLIIAPWVGHALEITSRISAYYAGKPFGCNMHLFVLITNDIFSCESKYGKDGFFLILKIPLNCNAISKGNIR